MTVAECLGASRSVHTTTLIKVCWYISGQTLELCLKLRYGAALGDSLFESFELVLSST